MRTENLSEHTGVQVWGVDLARPLAEDERDTLARLFAARSVLVIRDQALTPQGLLAAVRQFGEVFAQHNSRFALAECPDIHYISNQDRYDDGSRYIPGSGYHTDHSNASQPPKATVLHAVSLPTRGGDTQFVNMQRAYDTLDAPLRQRIARLRAVHVYQSRHSERKLMGLPPEKATVAAAEVSHPLVRTHAESGRKSIYLNPIRIDRIGGLGEDEGLALLDTLLTHATREVHQYRHRWLPGDWVMWDNRALLHKANADYDMSETRYLYRVMLQGETPV